MNDKQKRVVRDFDIWLKANRDKLYKYDMPELVYLIVDDVSIFVIEGIKNDAIVRGRAFVDGELSGTAIVRTIQGATGKPRFIRNINRYYLWDERIKYNIRRKLIEQLKNIPTEMHPSLLPYERIENHVNKAYQNVQRCFFQHLTLAEHRRTDKTTIFKIHGIDGKPLPTDISCYVQLYVKDNTAYGSDPNQLGSIVVSYQKNNRDYVCLEEIPVTDHSLNVEVCIRRAYPMK